jgi:broad specificity phosphatase PhoE
LAACARPCDIARRHAELPAIEDDRLMEWNCGDWSGCRHPEIRERWPEHYAAWDRDKLAVAAPSGERFLDLVERAQLFLQAHPVAPGRSIAIVAHGVINRALACVTLGWPPERMLDIRQGNDVVFALSVGPEGATAAHFVSGEGPLPGLPAKTGPILA